MALVPQKLGPCICDNCSLFSSGLTANRIPTAEYRDVGVPFSIPEHKTEWYETETKITFTCFEIYALKVICRLNVVLDFYCDSLLLKQL